MTEIHFSKVDSTPTLLKITTGSSESSIMKAVTYQLSCRMTLTASFTSPSTTQIRDMTGNVQHLSSSQS